MYRIVLQHMFSIPRKYGTGYLMQKAKDVKVTELSEIGLDGRKRAEKRGNRFRMFFLLSPLETNN